jgi:hypothetical protein
VLEQVMVMVMVLVMVVMVVMVMVMQVSLAARAGALASVHSFGTSFPDQGNTFTNTICTYYEYDLSRILCASQPWPGRAQRGALLPRPPVKPRPPLAS